METVNSQEKNITKITNSQEEYLKTIFILEKNNKKVRVTDIAEKLHITKPSVNKAINILKPGGEIVYSTCSILACENEDIINKALLGSNTEIIPIDFNGKEYLPLLPVKIPGTLCVCPDEFFEGFFIAKIRKI